MKRSSMKRKHSLLLTSWAALLATTTGCGDMESQPAAPEAPQSKLKASVSNPASSAAAAITRLSPLDQLRDRIGKDALVAPGEILLKFKDTEPVGTVANALLARGQNFSSVAGSTSLDRLNAKFGARSMVRLSREGVASVPAGALSLATAQNLHRQRLQAVTSSAADAGNLYRVRFSRADLDAKAAADEYAKDPAVAYATPNYQRPTTFSPPNDPLYPEQWAHQATGIEAAWDATLGSSSVVIAIIDTGVAYNHPDLTSKIWYSATGTPGWDFVDVDPAALESKGYILDPNEDYPTADDAPSDEFGHGTHCAGIAGAATNNGLGIAGVAINPRIMPLRAGYTIGMNLNGTTQWTAWVDDAATIQAIDYAIANGASVISMSFGGLLESKALGEAIERAKAAGLVLVAAAGNSNSSSLGYPASHAGVIAVAATDRANARASYSSFGARVDIAAPGGDLDASGAMTWASGILSTVPFSGPLKDVSGYRALRGTSMATPYIAGVAGLLRSKYPAISAADVRTRLTATGMPVVGANYNEMGGGLVNVAQALTAAPRPFLSVGKVDIIEKSGNGNGIIEAGETATVAVELTNIWADAQSASLHLASPSADITITNPTATLGAVAGGAALRTEALGLTIGSVLDRDTVFSLTLTIDTVGEDGTSYQWSTQVPVLVGTKPLVSMLTAYVTVSGRTAAYLGWDGVSRFDVYTSDLITGVQTRITQVPEYDFLKLLFPFSVNVAGDWVVYTDTRKGIDDTNVYLYDPARGEVVVTDAPGLQVGSGISGTRVVWFDSSTGTDQVFVRDMADLNNPAVLVHDGTDPRISGNRIAFSLVSDTTQKDIYVYDLSTGSTTAVLAEPGDQQLSAISGNLLLYVDADTSLRVLNLDTGNRTTVTTQSVLRAHAWISGTKVVWSDTRNGQLDVYTRDLADATGQELRLTRTPGRHTEPRISGNRIVWGGSYPTSDAPIWTELGPELGDANYNSAVDIVDALVVANHSVGNPTPRFFSSAADVNCDSSIDIVDALLIAQRSVGNITRFSCQPE
jgi:subtilisin family serine protease